jgi:transcriptional regulator NrdR family protein
VIKTFVIGRNNWKFEPDPITRSYINNLDKSPVDFRRIEIITKDVEEKLKDYHLASDYKEQLTYLFEQLKDYDFYKK